MKGYLTLIAILFIIGAIGSCIGCETKSEDNAQPVNRSTYQDHQAEPQASNTNNYTHSANQSAPSKFQPNKKKDIDVLVEIESRLKKYNKELQAHYPSNEMIDQINKDITVVSIASSAYRNPKNDEQKKILQKIRAVLPRMESLRRRMYAENMELIFVQKGLDARITATGDGNKVLRFKYVLMNRAFAYNLANEGHLIEGGKSLGFKKLVFTDGYDSSWTYDLRKY